ncbi:FadR/GntR family transcriptional regulator [Hydrogenophaga palleronii]|uniref:FadR/GntR family transcriptional regulator n=1 Tax=Hydrogenophaga palleronii TaxID=65655 RepID=UPI000825B6A9|nr:FCD domain-containing protein [Hydrogenophaga palleronii]
MVKRERSEIEYEVVQTSRAFEEVIAQLRRLTVQGQLKPGDRLPSERDLALKLGVSRNTIREALRGLEMSGVLELRKGAYGGAFLVAPGGDTLAGALQDMFQFGSVTAGQLTEARLHITAAVARVACERIREEDIRDLERNVADAQQAERDGDVVLRSRINLNFHRVLARTTDNPIFVAVMDGLISIMEHFIDTLGPPQIPDVFKSRMKVIAALRARNAEVAAAEMEDNLRVVHKGYLARLEQGQRAPTSPVPAPAAKPPASRAAARPAGTAATKAAAKAVVVEEPTASATRRVAAPRRTAKAK